ncbi:1-deoxy-D-xylulose-5-phosphate synthase [candidate division WOR-3 bacterium RBG_13_43_14]|uniref:1-deoxy-D-xylulose-5-phosphate synthase n=1 Tax=candidate division WOR-3 bacterium RBG_13_43_14 TaxID=1802590 RepID=A0A1F4UFL0_UNCW3|nr:MAG: 1-deoxy-D-xylulose-5-phosphate synthase [candidate division WOR-3 bacterium RBG_13_43_14]
MSILNRIKKPNDIKDLSIEELQVLAQEIREQIINTCADTGGHVAPSLGVVELTLALYRVFDAERDKIIWDVGHQTYAQKLITGRYERFKTLRTFKGISGFPKRKESKYDVFNTGHSSTSLSAATGFAIARDFNGDDYQIISVIGDGSLGAGMAFEALNHLGHLKKNMLVVLNDNERSIGESVGALSQYLTRIITTRTYNRFRDDIWKFLDRTHPYFRDRSRNLAKRVEEGLKGLYAPAVIFEELGFRYIGPLNGHKLGELIDTFSRVKEMHGPKIVHVVTKKGKGYELAEKNPETFHGIGPYCVESGETKSGSNSYTSVFGDALVKLAQKNDRIIAITAGMCLGTGLVRFREEIPSRFFDVGITEQHAVTMAAALALEKFIPVCAIYSTFLQRAYDQIIHDVSLQDAPVIFAVDRAGLVGADGPTHHGPFDLSYFRCLPNMVISTPKDGNELIDLLYTAVKYRQGPFVIRYPRGSCQVDETKQPMQIQVGSWDIVVKGSKIALLAVGSMVDESNKALKLLGKQKAKPTLVNVRFIKPMDVKLLDSILASHNYIITVEDNSIIGGFGDAILAYCAKKEKKIKVVCIGLPDEYIEHGSREELFEVAGISAKHISQEIIKLL